MKKSLTNILLLTLIAFSLPQIILAEETETRRTSAEYSARIEGIKTETRLRAEKIRAEAQAKMAEAKAQREATRADRDDKREELKTERLASSTEREARKAEQVEKARVRIQTYAGLMTNRFEAAIERLEILAKRIESRITKMESEKIEVTEAKTLLLNAQAKIALAKAQISGVEPILTSILTSPNPKDTMRPVGDFLKSTKESLKSAHVALVEVIKSLKPGQNREKENESATSTDDEINSAN